MNTHGLATGISRKAAFRAALNLFDLLVMAALLVIPFVWLFHPLKMTLGPLRLHISWGLKPILAPLVFLTGRMALASFWGRYGYAVQSLMNTRGYKRLVLMLISLYLFVASMESALAAIGFKAELPPIIFIGKDSQGGVIKSDTLPDAKLMFKYEPGSIFAGRRINRMGFREREVDPEKKPGTIRVICMGDSVTAQGRPGYSQYLHERLTNSPPTHQPWEAFNMGVHGYSSIQGLKLFQTRGKLLKPDIVTIWFGWNDHWMCDKTDREKMAIETGVLTGPIMEALHRKRLYMFLVRALKPVRHQLRKNGERPFRAPPAEYQATLKMLVQETRKAGAIPILLTAPRRSLTETLVAKGFVISPEEGQRIHDQYADMTRAVARDTQAFLLDLAAIFAGKECDSYFARDGIHFDNYEAEPYLTDDLRPQPGLQRVAAELDAKIREIVHSREWQNLH